MVRVRVSVKVRVSVMVSLVGFRSSRPEFAGLCSRFPKKVKFKKF